MDLKFILLSMLACHGFASADDYPQENLKLKLPDSCYEVLEVIQLWWTIEGYYKAKTEKEGHIEAGPFPTIGNPDTTHSIGLFRDGWNGTNKGKVILKNWIQNLGNTEESTIAFYILEPDFLRNGKYFSYFSKYEFYGPIFAGFYGRRSSVMSSEDIKQYLGANDTLDVVTEITRVRVIPSCQNDSYPNSGRGHVKPKSQYDIVATYCTVLSSGSKSCSPMDPYYGFGTKKLAPNGGAGSYVTKSGDIEKENETLKKLLKIKDEEIQSLKENCLA